DFVFVGIVVRDWRIAVQSTDGNGVGLSNLPTSEGVPILAIAARIHKQDLDVASRNAMTEQGSRRCRNFVSLESPRGGVILEPRITGFERCLDRGQFSSVPKLSR